MFGTKKDDLRLGDLVVVGSEVNGKFMPLSAAKAKVERIWNDPTTSCTQIDLDWGKFGKSRVYLHDQNKTWTRISNFN